MAKIKVQNTEITVVAYNDNDYISLTDMARSQMQEQLKIWHEQNPELKGNIRDYASINELICLSNMENLNAVFIDQGIPQGERLIKLNQIAIQQMRILEDDGKRKLLK